MSVTAGRKPAGITVREALSLGALRKARLVAGQGGLDNIIRYVSVIEVPDAYHWFRGGELWLTAFYALRHDPQGQEAMLREMWRRGSAALAICYPDLYVGGIPPNIIAAAEDLDFPLLTLPNDVAYVEVITPVLNAIRLRHMRPGGDAGYTSLVERARREDRRKVLLELLTRAPDDGTRSSQVRRLQLVGCDVDTPALVIAADSLLDAAAVHRLARRHGLPMADVMDVEGRSVIVLQGGPGAVDGGMLAERARLVAHALQRETPAGSDHDAQVARPSLGVGTVAVDLLHLAESYADARQALRIGLRLHGPGAVADMEDLGLLPVLEGLDRREALRATERILGPLFAHDARHGTDLVNTLRALLRHERPADAARALFVHRNTVLKRRDKICQLLGYNPFVGDRRLQVHLALVVRALFEG